MPERAVSRDVALNYLDVQGTVRMRRSTARTFTPGTVLLRHPIALLSIPATYDAYLQLGRPENAKHDPKGGEGRILVSRFRLE